MNSPEEYLSKLPEFYCCYVGSEASNVPEVFLSKLAEFYFCYNGSALMNAPEESVWAYTSPVIC